MTYIQLKSTLMQQVKDNSYRLEIGGRLLLIKLLYAQQHVPSSLIGNKNG